MKWELTKTEKNFIRYLDDNGYEHTEKQYVSKMAFIVCKNGTSMDFEIVDTKETTFTSIKANFERYWNIKVQNDKKDALLKSMGYQV